MLQWKVKELLAEKGYPHPHKWMLNCKLNNTTAYKILNNKQQRVDLKHLNAICEAAYCTPNDLFVWQPKVEAQYPPTHPLQALRSRTITNISQKLKTMSAEQIIALGKFVDGMEE